MYQSPDVIKVKVSVKDVFASYGKMCDPVNYTIYNSANDCSPTDSMYIHVNMLADPNPYECYANLNAP